MSRPYLRSVGTSAVGIGDITPALPAGWQENDIFLLAVQSCNQAISAPSGWTELSSSPQGTGTAAAAGSVRLGLFWRRATSSESAPTVTDTGDHTLGIIAAFCECIESGSPIDAEAGDVLTPASDAITWPGVTTTVDCALVVNVLAIARDTNVNQVLPTITNADLVDPALIVEVNSNTGTGGGLYFAAGLKLAAGAVTTSTAAISAALTSLQGRITLALKPRVSSRPYFVSAGALATSTGNISAVGIPSTYAANDIFLMLVESANQAAAAPSGWAAVGSSPQGTGTAGAAGGTRLTVFWKRASASESAPALADTGDHQNAQIICLRGCVTSGDPWEASAGDVEASATTAVTFPAVTTLGTDRLIVQMIGHDSGAALLSGWTTSTMQFLAEIADFVTLSGSDGGIAAAIGGMNSAGSIGSSTATLAGAVAQGRITLAFAPDGGGGGTWVPRIVMF